MIFRSQASAPAQDARPAGPPRSSNTGQVIALFCMGVLIFAGTMVLLGFWLRKPAGSLSDGSGLPPSISGAGSGGAMERPGQTARTAARRNEYRIFFTSDGLKLNPQVRRPEGEQRAD